MNILKNNKGNATTIGIVVVLIIIALVLLFVFNQNKNDNDGVMNGDKAMVEDGLDMMGAESDEMMEGGAGDTMMVPADDAMMNGEEVNEMMVGGDAMVGNEDAMMEGGDEMMDEGSSAMVNIKEFKVNGSKFDFSLDEIRVKKGDKVKIVFTSTDGLHDWVVDEFSASTKQVNEGETSTVEFVADKTGTFEFYCSVGQHRDFGMVGNLIVE